MCVTEFFLISLLLAPSSPSAEGDVRLVSSGTAQCFGRVELFHASEWGTVCDDDWSIFDAEVVCRQLDCGTAVDNIYGSRFGEGIGPIWLKNAKCSGVESALTHCPNINFGVQDCKHHEDAGVVCMKPPTISAEVTSTQEVSVTCSVSPAFTGGVMVLKQFNKTVQTSNSNPVMFTFPRGVDDHDGLFHCLYQEHVLDKTYSSPQSPSVTAESRVPHVQVVALLAAGGVLLLLVLLAVLLGVVCYRRRSTSRGSAPPQIGVGAESTEDYDKSCYASADLPSDDDYENAGQEEVNEEVSNSVGSAEDHDEVYHATSDYESVDEEEVYENVDEEHYLNVGQEKVEDTSVHAND